MFQINDKVVCVNDKFERPSIIGRERPVKDRVYVVEGFAPSCGMFRITPGLRDSGYEVSLVGLVGPWNTARFRKLADIKTENAAKRGEFCHA